jgi:hypothetical protein
VCATAPLIVLVLVLEIERALGLCVQNDQSVRQNYFRNAERGKTVFQNEEDRCGPWSVPRLRGRGEQGSIKMSKPHSVGSIGEVYLLTHQRAQLNTARPPTHSRARHGLPLAR